MVNDIKNSQVTQDRAWKTVERNNDKLFDFNLIGAYKGYDLRVNKFLYESDR